MPPVAAGAPRPNSAFAVHASPRADLALAEKVGWQHGELTADAVRRCKVKMRAFRPHERAVNDVGAMLNERRVVRVQS